MALLLFFAFVACSLAQELQCDFKMRSTTMTSGYVNGNVVYSWSNQFFLNTYTTSGSKELYQFNSGNGYTNFQTQFQYSFSATCPCSISALSAAQPALHPSSAFLVASGEKFVPTNTASMLTSVTFDAADFPVQAVFKDGKTFDYTNCRAYSLVAADKTPPSSCSCGKPIDIVLVLDRSSSIDKSEFILEKDFAKNLVKAFNYGPLAVNLGITNFHSLTWDGPVTLSQGNNVDSVSAGADALQCYPEAQCVLYGSSLNTRSCCGIGTCVSAGIVNGAEMLATANDNGVRASAAKVLIVLTDGYHNRILNKDRQGNLVRTNTGKVQGLTYSVNGRTCNEDKTQTDCAAGLLADLQWAVDYAVSKVPTVAIFGIGVGTTWDRGQLLTIANGNPDNVFGTTDWNQLSSILDQLVLQTCQQSPETSACKGCCGFCSCSGCIQPDGCDPSTNFCDTVQVAGTCCSSVPKPVTGCDEDDKCKTYACDNTLNDNKGGCTSTVKPVTPNTTCAGYTCDPLTGKSVYTDLCPPKCFVAADCDDNNACTLDNCVIPGDAHSAYCENSVIDCAAGGDKCSTYTCDPVVGCSSTKNPIPVNTTCSHYVCDPAIGTVEHIDQCPALPACYADLDCQDNNPCTVDVCEEAGDVDLARCTYTATDCSGTDWCQLYSCNPAVEGGCVSEPRPFAQNTTCAGYACDSINKNITFVDLCPPQPPCINNTGCDDLNACTVDVCVLNATNPLNNYCDWTDISEECDDGDACTIDFCNVTTGCQVKPLEWERICNDNDACTIDSCDPLSYNFTFPCVYEDVICNDTDICHHSICSPQEGCLVLDIVCPTSDNCTVSGCNSTPGEGCYINKAGVCGVPVPIIAGIAAGVIAGIVVAAVAGAFIVGGGSAYAFTQGAGAGLGATVSNSPIYAEAGEKGYNPLHRV